MSKKHHGSSLDDFLKDEGVFEETQALAVKEVVVWQLTEAMQQRSLTKTQLATMLKTSRSQVDRLLDPTRDVTLSTLQRAAALVGRKVQIELVQVEGAGGFVNPQFRLGAAGAAAMSTASASRCVESTAGGSGAVAASEFAQRVFRPRGRSSFPQEVVHSIGPHASPRGAVEQVRERGLRGHGGRDRSAQ